VQQLISSLAVSQIVNVLQSITLLCQLTTTPVSKDASHICHSVTALWCLAMSIGKQKTKN